MLFKYVLVKYDMIRDEPVKDRKGFCLHVAKGEAGGQMVGVRRKSDRWR